MRSLAVYPDYATTIVDYDRLPVEYAFVTK